MKTIGVLGGLGPQATMDFEARVHAEAQRLIPPRGNSGYPPMIVCYLRQPPVMLNADGAPVMPLQPDPALLDAARKLGQLADFLVITANGPHAFQSLIEQAAGRPMLSMVDLTIGEVQRRGWRTVGALALGPPQIYRNPLEQVGLPCEAIEPDLQMRLDQAIIRLMEGGEGPADHATAREAVEVLRDRSVDGIILGCTEIPLLLGEDAEAPDLLDPAKLLAEASVRRAIE